MTNTPRVVQQIQAFFVIDDPEQTGRFHRAELVMTLYDNEDWLVSSPETGMEWVGDRDSGGRDFIRFLLGLSRIGRDANAPCEVQQVINDR